MPVIPYITYNLGAIRDIVLKKIKIVLKKC